MDYIDYYARDLDCEECPSLVLKDNQYKEWYYLNEDTNVIQFEGVDIDTFLEVSGNDFYWVNEYGYQYLLETIRATQTDDNSYQLIAKII